MCGQIQSNCTTVYVSLWGGMASRPSHGFYGRWSAFMRIQDNQLGWVPTLPAILNYARLILVQYVSLKS